MTRNPSFLSYKTLFFVSKTSLYQTDSLQFRASLFYKNVQKYNFESKSQLPILNVFGVKGFIRTCKSTILKANHNYLDVIGINCLFYKNVQKYNFESKSQLYCYTLPCLIVL